VSDFEGRQTMAGQMAKWPIANVPALFGASRKTIALLDQTYSCRPYVVEYPNSSSSTRKACTKPDLGLR
jgi:hypothetical protein